MHRDLVESLFARFREPIYWFLHRLLRDSAAAEDLTQETFVRALRAEYRANGQERAWVFQIARNLARDHVRAGSRRPAASTIDEEPAAPDSTLRIEIDRALASLAAEDREVFLLKELAGLSYIEIAAACGLTSDAVRSRLHRTRLTLRAALSAPASLKRVGP